MGAPVRALSEQARKASMDRPINPPFFCGIFISLAINAASASDPYILSDSHAFYTNKCLLVRILSFREVTT
jgi:hypothetical protein